MRKTARTEDIIIATLVALVLFFIITSVFFTRVTSEITDHGVSYIEDPDPDTIFFDTLSTSLPYSTYRHLYDSAEHANNKIRDINDGSIEGFSIAAVGLYTFKTCNSCKPDKYMQEDPENMDTTYYIGLKDYYFKNELQSIGGSAPNFFRKEGKNYVKYKDSLRINGELHLKPMIKEVPFRYEADSKTVEFQLSKTAYYISWLLLIIYMILHSGGLLWSGICVIRLSLSIARGAFFTEENQIRLTFCAWYALFASLSAFVLYWLLRLSWHNSLKTWFSSNITDTLQPGMFIIAIIFWLLSKAFNRGLQLQQEHDLTV